MTSPNEPPSPESLPQRPAWHGRILRQMFIHQVVFCVIIGSLNLYNILDGAPWWALWPSMIWGVLLTIHVCIVRSITVDEGWVDQRAAELREHSYDFGHMHDLEHRIVESDFSVVPREEREHRDRDDNKGSNDKQ